MSILDMDVTIRRDAAVVRSRQFATVRKGYDPDQVRAYLDHLSGWIEDLQDDLADARADAAALAKAPAAPAAPAESPGKGVDPYEALGARVADVLRTAEDHAKRVRTEAETTAERTLEESRQEAARIRQQAQEESGILREAAEEQAESTRRTAQEEADRVRQEAAKALEAARVEAERTVAALSERRSVLTAELHATRSRLLGIVSQLEEDQLEAPTGEAQDIFEQDPIAIPRAGNGFIAPDDPRRDPVPPDIPAFVPPPPPAKTPITPFSRPLSGEVASLELPVSDETGPALDVEEEHHLESETEAPSSSGGGSAIEADESAIEGDESALDVGEASIEADEVAIDEPATQEAAIPQLEATGDEATTDEDVEEIPWDRPATAEDRWAPGDAIEQSDDESSFLHWTDEEAKGGRRVDLSLPDFPSIDLPTLEDDQQPWD